MVLLSNRLTKIFSAQYYREDGPRVARVRKKIKIRKSRNPTSRTRAKAETEKEKVKEVEAAGVTMEIQWMGAMISSIACAHHVILDTELQLKKNLE
jgi:hypothetical protein